MSFILILFEDPFRNQIYLREEGLECAFVGAVATNSLFFFNDAFGISKQTKVSSYGLLLNQTTTGLSNWSCVVCWHTLQFFPSLCIYGATSLLRAIQALSLFGRCHGEMRREGVLLHICVWHLCLCGRGGTGGGDVSRCVFCRVIFLKIILLPKGRDLCSFLFDAVRRSPSLLESSTSPLNWLGKKKKISISRVICPYDN